MSGKKANLLKPAPFQEAGLIVKKSIIDASPRYKNRHIFGK
jgi:hypothetical protein